MKFISWNVNGLRACIGKGFMDYFNSMDADFFCCQESHHISILLRKSVTDVVLVYTFNAGAITNF